MRRIYAGVTDPSTGAIIHPGPYPGSEADWAGLMGEQLGGMGPALFQNIVYGDPAWTLSQFDLAKDFEAKREAAALIDADNPDLTEFNAHGGKLLMYHGLADGTVIPQRSIDYLGAVASCLPAGQKAEDFVRLFLVPGMSHCIAGADGVAAFDALTALEQWTEHGIAPDSMVGTRPEQFLFLGYNVTAAPPAPVSSLLYPSSGRLPGGNPDDRQVVVPTGAPAEPVDKESDHASCCSGPRHRRTWPTRPKIVRIDVAGDFRRRPPPTRSALVRRAGAVQL